MRLLDELFEKEIWRALMDEESSPRLFSDDTPEAERQIGKNDEQEDESSIC